MLTVVKKILPLLLVLALAAPSRLGPEQETA